jgi:hypothetical protein
MALIDKIGMNRWWLKADSRKFVGSSYSWLLEIGQNLVCCYQRNWNEQLFDEWLSRPIKDQGIMSHFWLNAGVVLMQRIYTRLMVFKGQKYLFFMICHC